MTKHDIRDYGAKVDGSTDDTQAVQDAIASASAGDTVYFPSGTTVVRSSGGSALNVNKSHSGLTLKGEGKESVVKLGGGHDNFCSILLIEGDTGVTNFLVEGLRFDGNKSNNQGTNTVNVLANPGGAENDVLIQDCWFSNATNTGLGLSAAGCVGRRLTAYNNGKHGFAADNADTPLEPRVEYHDILAYNNGLYGLDASAGKTLVDGFVLQDNGYGTKATNETVDNVYRNGLIQNNDAFGYQLTGLADHSQQVTFENVTIRDNGSAGMRIVGNADYTFKKLLALRNNSSGSSNGNLVIYHDVSVTGTEVQSGEAQNGAGMYVGAGRVDFSKYVHSGNADTGGGTGVTGDTSSVNIDTNLTAPCEPLDVPTESEVGAGSDGTGSGGATATAGSVLKTTSGSIRSTKGTLNTQ